MATIITQLDRTTGNYQDVFTYTLNASFNGIDATITDARIEFFLPNFCEISLGDLEYPVRETRTEPRTGGTQYIIDFGTLEDTGVSVRIGFGIVFARIAENGASYALAPEFWLNGVLEEQTPADTITLTLAPRFEVRKEVVLPTADPAAGGFVYYLVTLQNFGDLGARIENVNIEALATEGLTIDESFAIIGKDASTANFTDTTMDGVQGRVEGGIVYFNIASYRGEIYTFLYRAILAETLTIGQTLETELRWQSDDDAQGQAAVPHTLTLGAPSESLSLSLYGADYALGGDAFAYEWRMNNTGNQVLTAARCLLTLTQGITYTTLRTGSFQRRALGEVVDADYQINYTTAAGASGVLGSFNMGGSQNVDLTVVAAGDNILTLEWVFAAYGIGVRQRTVPRLLGVVAENIADGTVLESTATASWQVGIAGEAQGERAEKNAPQQTEIANTCVLQPSFSASVGATPQRPGDAFRYTLSAYAYRSALRAPVFAVLLPAVLSYQGEASLTLSGIFGDALPALPPASITQNYNAAGDTLIQFAFVGQYACTLSQLSRLNLSFLVAVKIGARGAFAASGLLNVAVGSGAVASNSTRYAESEAAASALGFALAAPYAQTAVVEQQILFFAATSTQKQVRGLIDTTFVGIGGTGQTVSGGAAWYALSVRNIGNADLQTVEIVDILPYVGDTAVLSASTARKSEFTLPLLGEIAAALIDGTTGQEIAEVPFAIRYTTSTDPIRFGGRFDTIGTDDIWQTDLPDSADSAQLQRVAAIKVSCSTPLLPGQSLLVLVAATAPDTAPEGATAWNSFAAEVTYDDADGVRQTMLATEASKAGLLIQPLAVLQASLPKAQKRLLSDILRANRSARSVMRNVIYNQMLIGMKNEEVLDLIDL